MGGLYSMVVPGVQHPTQFTFMQHSARPNRAISARARHKCGHEYRVLREVRDHFSDVVDRVQHERVTVKRNGKAAAVTLNPEDLAQLEETLAVLSDPEALADIREADLAYQEGYVVRGADAAHALRP